MIVAQRLNTIGDLIGVEKYRRTGDIGMTGKATKLPGVSAANWNSCRNYGKFNLLKKREFSLELEKRSR